MMKKTIKLQPHTISRKRMVVYWSIAALMIVLIAASICDAVYFASLHHEKIYLKETIAIIGLLFAAILFVSCIVNLKEDTKQGRYYVAISALLFNLILFAGIIDSFAGTPVMSRLFMPLGTISALMSATIHLLFWYYQCNSLPDKKRRKIYTCIIHSGCLLYVCLLIANVFNGVLFYADEAGNLQWPGIAIETSVTILFYVVYLIYILPQKCSRRKKFALLSFAVFPMAIILISIVWVIIDIETTALSQTYIFLLLAAYVVFFVDYKDNQEHYIQQKAELAELQTQLVLSQIRPHFLYNALTAIRNLCKNDPQEAYDALGRFSDYLRGNMEALGDGHIIPFEKELEHIKTYLMLEQMRFGDDLKVEYDIRFQDFSLPALTIEPIVENAVRHGAVMNENGGLVTIRTEDAGEDILITVADNGPGFDPNAPIKDGKTHFGIANVKNSLAVKGYGDLTIDSTPGVGTIVIIRIRKEMQ